MEATEHKVLSDLIDYYIDMLVKRVIYDIRRTPKEAMLSGDDSELKSVWEELCAQLQDEHFFGWDLVDDMVSLICATRFEELPYPVQFALTYEACSLYGEEIEAECSFTERVADMIKEKVYDYALNYENKHISNYLERVWSSD
jgi:hypothetical protein